MATREKLFINDIIIMFDNATRVNQFQRYDVTCFAAPSQLKELEEKVNKIVKEKKYPESVPVTYTINGVTTVVNGADGQPIMAPGYNKPFKKPDEKTLIDIPEVSDMMILKAGSKFAAKAWIKDTADSKPRAMGIEDTEFDSKGKIVSILVSLNPYDTVSEGKRKCGVALYLEQILYTNIDCGFLINSGGDNKCAWDK
jgi:hypothetical protein